jgi:RNA polymerase sigma factor (TIGR02999 family)
MSNAELTELVRDAEQGGAQAKERLFAHLYQELHQLAERQLRRSGGTPISPTTLLHETYLSLAASEASFPDRGRFMGYAARVMRGLIIDFARQRGALKRGADFHITRINTLIADSVANADDLVRLSDALDELAAYDGRLAEVVDLKYFCGFSLGDIAAMRGMSERTVKRDWDKARLFLFREIGHTDDGGEVAPQP